MCAFEIFMEQLKRAKAEIFHFGPSIENMSLPINYKWMTVYKYINWNRFLNTCLQCVEPTTYVQHTNIQYKIELNLYRTFCNAYSMGASARQLSMLLPFALCYCCWRFYYWSVECIWIPPLICYWLECICYASMYTGVQIGCERFFCRLY